MLRSRGLTLLVFSIAAMAVFSTCAIAQVAALEPSSAEYQAVQRRLAQGWNTWDTNSMTTHVLLPEGLAVHVGFKHNSTEFADGFLEKTSVGAGTVFPGPHAWDGSYTDLKVTWRKHVWRVQSARDGEDLVLLVTPMETEKFAVPGTVVFSVDFLWNRPGTALKRADSIETHGDSGDVSVYCACANGVLETQGEIPVGGAY